MTEVSSGNPSHQNKISVVNFSENTPDGYDSDENIEREFEEVKRYSEKNIVVPIAKITNSDVERFALRNKLFVKQPGVDHKPPRDQWTHLIMTGCGGGGMCLGNSKDLNDQFLDAYALDIKYGRVHYIVEKRTPVFKFYADFDIKRKAPMAEESIIELVSDLVHCAKRFYPPTTAASRFDVVVLGAIDVGKIGLHPIFPNLYVDDAQAITIRDYCVAYLITKYGDMSGIQNSWEDVVDQSVYGANGLRMIRSHKPGTCPVCDGKNKEKCDLCLYYGKVDIGRSYNPMFYLRDGKVHEQYTNAIKGSLDTVVDIDGVKRKVIELCSIRSFVAEPSSEFSMNGNSMPRYVAEDDPQVTLQPRTTKFRNSAPKQIFREIETKEGTHRVSQEEYETISRIRGRQYISPNSESFREIQNFIHSKPFFSQYRQVVVHDVFTNEKKSYYQVNVQGEGSKVCMNFRKQSHNSNRIYFYITPEAIYQKCYCRCETTENRRKGKCKDFRSKGIALPSKLTSLLFPKSNSKLGNLHKKRAIGILSDKDEKEQFLAQTIADLEDEHTQYQEERAKRLKNNKRKQNKNESQGPEIPQNRKRIRRKPKK